MIYKLQNGGVVKLQKAGLVPKIRQLVTKLNTPKTAIALDKSLVGAPKVIEHVPKVTVSEPYARVSRDLSTVNKAWSFSIDNDPFNTFQLIKDIEPKQYSVHFKTVNKHALSEPQKQMLFSAVADAVPGGSTLSTGGSVSKGGLAGLKRFEGLGFKPTLQTRTLELKMQPTVGEVFPFGELKADKIEVPILYKPREIVVGSKPITENELKGVIKMERNQPAKEKTYFDGQIDGIYDRLGSSKPRIRLPYTEEQILNEPNSEVADNMRYSRAKFLKQNDDQVENYLDFSGDAKDFRTKLSDFINQLDIKVAPEFNNTVVDGVSERNPYIMAYRNYLYQNGVDAAGVSDEGLAKILTYMQQMQRSGMTGKMKDRVPLGHGSKDLFDAFDGKLTGKNTGNSGAIGPGNYFSARGIRYGGVTGKLGLPLNFQPYYITGIESIPNGFMMQEKGILPEYLSKFAIRQHPDLFQAALEKEIPGANTTLYIDPSEPMQGMFDAPQAGFMLRRNTGIKSLFPHPSRFVRNADGTVTLISTDGSDVRVNFKQGGKI